MVAGYPELVHKKEQLIAEACNHPNCLVVPFRLELIRLAAQAARAVKGNGLAIASV
jgi:hypothetical protein